MVFICVMPLQDGITAFSGFVAECIRAKRDSVEYTHDQGVICVWRLHCASSLINPWGYSLVESNAENTYTNGSLPVQILINNCGDNNYFHLGLRKEIWVRICITKKLVVTQCRTAEGNIWQRACNRPVHCAMCVHAYFSIYFLATSIKLNHSDELRPTTVDNTDSCRDYRFNSNHFAAFM